MNPTPDRVAVVVGTRPEIIKLTRVVHLLGDRVDLIHSGQHYDENLSEAFLTRFALPEPCVRLSGVGAAPRHRQIGRIVDGLGAHFQAAPPACVVVQGDTNTACAAAQAAHFAGVPVVHVEAGLRSHDRAMPEEINRMLIGVLADLHCAPTARSAANLVAEGVDSARVIVTGNTVVEAVHASMPDPAAVRGILHEHGLESGSYVLATIHRPENTDDPERLSAILTQFAKLSVPVVLSLHPRTRAAAVRHGLEADLDRLRTVQPQGHQGFLALASGSRLLISDSGGVQEEATVLKKPLIVVRESTERPEAVEAGFAHLVRPGPAIGRAAESLLADAGQAERLKNIPCPFGDGTASARIVEAVNTRWPVRRQNRTEA